MSTDSIADMLTRIRNAVMVEKKQVVLPTSKVKLAIAQILKENKFIEDYRLEGKTIVVALSYRQGGSAITGIKRISKPGVRRYASYRGLKYVKSGMGIMILSTPQGLVTDREARYKKIGGELICSVW